MNSKTLINYIDNLESLNEANIFDLTLLTDRYPFFQSAQLLRIKSLHKISPSGITPILNYTAAYVTDRKILYYLLHPIKELENKSDLKSTEKEIKDSMVENISDTLTNQVNYSDNIFDTELEFTSSIDIKKEYGKDVELNEYVVRISEEGPLMELFSDEESDILEDKSEVESIKQADLMLAIKRGSLADIDINNDNLTENQKTHNALIDSFITLNPKIDPHAGAQENIDISLTSVQENDHYLTDTLAQIYLKQANYAKAIFAYEKLSLKFPEKSVYFASRIVEIKKLINKTK